MAISNIVALATKMTINQRFFRNIIVMKEKLKEAFLLW